MSALAGTATAGTAGLATPAKSGWGRSTSSNTTGHFKKKHKKTFFSFLFFLFYVFIRRQRSAAGSPDDKREGVWFVVEAERETNKHSKTGI